MKGKDNTKDNSLPFCCPDCGTVFVEDHLDMILPKVTCPSCKKEFFVEYTVKKGGRK